MSGDWAHGLCGCCSNCNSCCMTWWCPCVVIGEFKFNKKNICLKFFIQLPIYIKIEYSDSQF